MTPPKRDESASPKGHRTRLRQRLIDGGPTALADYELVEMILFQANPRGDTKPLARRLLKRFGDMAGLAAASNEQLGAVDGCGPAAIAAIRSMQAAAQAILRGRLQDAPVLSAWDQVEDYLRVAMGAAPREHFRVLYLDRKNRLIADEIASEGTVSQTTIFPREIARRALELSASAVLLAHNHPSGDPTPSREDVQMTARVAAACSAIDVTVHDHLVIAANRTASLKALGLM